MNKFMILAVLFLAGCAKDHYTVIPDGKGTQEQMDAALHDCKTEVYDKFHADNSPLGGGTAGIAGVLGGAVGGALVGAVSGAETPDNAMKWKDVYPSIEKCMKKRGYSGSSS